MHLVRIDQARTLPAAVLETDKYGLTDDDFQLLNELAFAAALRGLKTETEAIASAIEAIAPEHAAPMIARGLLHWASGQRQEAIRLLRDVGMKKERRWEEAGMILLQLLDPDKDANDVRKVRRALDKSIRDDDFLDHRDD